MERKQTTIKAEFQGIDEREFKCSCSQENCCQSGISFDGNILRFHFLELSVYNSNTHGSVTLLEQKTKAMYLDKSTTNELIKYLKSLKF